MRQFIKPTVCTDANREAFNSAYSKAGNVYWAYSSLEELTVSDRINYAVLGIDTILKMFLGNNGVPVQLDDNDVVKHWAIVAGRALEVTGVWDVDFLLEVISDYPKIFRGYNELDLERLIRVCNYVKELLTIRMRIDKFPTFTFLEGVKPEEIDNFYAELVDALEYAIGTVSTGAMPADVVDAEAS